MHVRFSSNQNADMVQARTMQKTALDLAGEVIKKMQEDGLPVAPYNYAQSSTVVQGLSTYALAMDRYMNSRVSYFA